MIFVALGAEIKRCRTPEESTVVRTEDVIGCFLPFLFLRHNFVRWAKYIPRNRERSIQIEINRSITEEEGRGSDGKIPKNQKRNLERELGLWGDGGVEKYRGMDVEG